MQRNNLLLLLLILLLRVHLYAQQAPPEIQDDQILESVSDQTESSFDFDTYTETLNDLRENPLNLNAAEYDDLVASGLFTAEQANEIITYRKRMNGFASLYELQSLETIDFLTIRSLLPFVTIRPIDKAYKTPFKRMAFGGNYQLFLRYTQVLEEQKGYTITDTNRSCYLGSQQRYYVRFRYNYSTKISYGLTMEKDPGEEFFKGTQKQGFDYYSGHLFIRNVWKFKAIAIGDYQMKLGQGLTMWTGFGYRKSPSVMNIQKNATGITQYTSVNEYSFLRGAAATMQFGRLSATGFFSRNRQDANFILPDTDESLEEEVSSLDESGLHRTPTEVRFKDALKLTTFGGNAKYRFNKGVLGVNAVHTMLDRAITPSAELYKKYGFSGANLTNISIDYSFIVRNFNFFGETAMTDNLDVATINGVTINEGSKIEMAFLHRWFSKTYYSFFNNAFAESSSPSNESGFYAGMIVRPIKNWRFDTYFDFYKFPWLKYLVDAPSNGFDYYAQLNYTPTRNVLMYAYYRYENKQANVTGNDTKVDYLTYEKRQSARFNINYRINSKIELRNRFEVVWYDDHVDPVEKGFMIYQDIKLTPFRFPFTIYARYTIFDTKSYDSRIYAYENDILYSFSIPPLYDNGFRYYIMLNYDISENISVWLRFAQTQFSDKETIGSGLDEIQGNARSEIKAQMRLKF